MLKTVLRRFTNMTSLIHMLQTRKITLLNPSSWDDKNDAHFMAEYKRKIGAKTVLALCLTRAGERYHHWRVFAGTPDGVAIDIQRHALTELFENTEGIEAKYVSYKGVKELTSMERIDVMELPFTKRASYIDEDEYRAVYVDNVREMSSLDIEFDLSWIKSITLGPWMPPAQKDSVEKTLRSILGSEKPKIVRSSMIENTVWREMATEAK